MADPSGFKFPAKYARLITPGAEALDPRPNAIYVSVSGTMTIANDDSGSTTAVLTVVAGSTIALQPWKITAATATLHGLFNDV